MNVVTIASWHGGVVDSSNFRMALARLRRHILPVRLHFLQAGGAAGMACAVEDTFPPLPGQHQHYGHGHGTDVTPADVYQSLYAQAHMHAHAHAHVYAQAQLQAHVRGRDEGALGEDAGMAGGSESVDESVPADGDVGAAASSDEVPAAAMEGSEGQIAGETDVHADSDAHDAAGDAPQEQDGSGHEEHLMAQDQYGTVHSKSGHRGIRMRRLVNGGVKYDVQLCLGGYKTKYLGAFNTLEDALAAYENKRRELAITDMPPAPRQHVPRKRLATGGDAPAYRGVTVGRTADGPRYYASLVMNGKKTRLGAYATAEAAARAYDRAAYEALGNHATLNFPLETIAAFAIEKGHTVDLSEVQPLPPADHVMAAPMYRGVTAMPLARGGVSYRAFIKFGGKRHLLGVFKRAEDAAHAYDAMARQHFGAAAKLNFPKEHERAALPSHAGALIHGHEAHSRDADGNRVHEDGAEEHDEHDAHEPGSHESDAPEHDVQAHDVPEEELPAHDADEQQVVHEHAAGEHVANEQAVLEAGVEPNELAEELVPYGESIVEPDVVDVALAEEGGDIGDDTAAGMMETGDELGQRSDDVATDHAEPAADDFDVSSRRQRTARTLSMATYDTEEEHDFMNAVWEPAVSSVLLDSSTVTAGRKRRREHVGPMDDETQGAGHILDEHVEAVLNDSELL